MRDLLTKLDAIISEAMSDADPDSTNKNSDKNIDELESALQDLLKNPIAKEDPAITKAILQKRAELDRLKGLK